MRTFLSTELLLLFVASAPAFALDGVERQHPPNIVFLLADDLRPDVIHALGNAALSTPNLDRLARRGTAFTRGIASYPLCVPSRAEILSGCSAFRNGVFPGVSNRLDENLILWPQALKSVGYRTCYVGKWHTSGRPSTRGYDESFGLFAGGGGELTFSTDGQGRPVTGYRGWAVQSDEGQIDQSQEVGLTPGIDRKFADAAIAFLRSQTDEPLPDTDNIKTKPERDSVGRSPFFLHVNFTGPHDPLFLPPGMEGKYSPADIPLPRNFLPEHPFDHGNLRGRDEQLWPWPRSSQTVREGLALYYAVITYLDSQVGRIMAALEETDQSDNTLVIFSSDHGLAIGSHGLRGKQNMYGHTVNVPLLIAGPGVPQNRRCAAQVYLRELYPTTCELAGVPTPATVEAESFAAVVRGEKQTHHDCVYAYFADTQRMVRDNRWKLIGYPQLDREQLFDLQADPDEINDLAANAQFAGVRDALREKLRAWQLKVGDPLIAKRGR